MLKIDDWNVVQEDTNLAPQPAGHRGGAKPPVAGPAQSLGGRLQFADHRRPIAQRRIQRNGYFCQLCVSGLKRTSKRFDNRQPVVEFPLLHALT